MRRALDPPPVIQETSHSSNGETTATRERRRSRLQHTPRHVDPTVRDAHQQHPVLESVLLKYVTQLIIFRGRFI